MNKTLRTILGVLVFSLLAPNAYLLAQVSLGTLTLTAIKARIFTPNGDGFNDKARFEFDNPDQLPVTGTVFDLVGAHVATLQPNADPDVLVWDGKDGDGQIVAGGIYIYQIEFQGKFATGTVVVTR